MLTYRSQQRAHSDLVDCCVNEPELISALLETAGEPVSDLQRTWEVIGAAIDRVPRYADVQYQAARAAFRSGQLPHAARLVEAALTQNPRYIDALVLAARISSVRELWISAEQYLLRAIAAGAEYADVYLLIGDVRRRLGRLDAAAEAFRHALQLNCRLEAARKALSELGAAPEGERNDELPA